MLDFVVISEIAIENHEISLVLVSCQPSLSLQWRPSLLTARLVFLCLISPLQIRAPHPHTSSLYQQPVCVCVCRCRRLPDSFSISSILNIKLYCLFLLWESHCIKSHAFIFTTSYF